MLLRSGRVKLVYGRRRISFTTRTIFVKWRRTLTSVSWEGDYDDANKVVHKGCFRTFLRVRGRWYLLVDKSEIRQNYILLQLGQESVDSINGAGHRNDVDVESLTNRPNFKQSFGLSLVKTKGIRYDQWNSANLPSSDNEICWTEFQFVFSQPIVSAESSRFEFLVQLSLFEHLTRLRIHKRGFTLRELNY